MTSVYQDKKILLYCMFLEVEMLYPVQTWWGTYLGYCSRRDGARNSG